MFYTKSKSTNLITIFLHVIDTMYIYSRKYIAKSGLILIVHYRSISFICTTRVLKLTNGVTSLGGPMIVMPMLSLQYCQRESLWHGWRCCNNIVSHLHDQTSFNVGKYSLHNNLCLIWNCTQLLPNISLTHFGVMIYVYLTWKVGSTLVSNN